MPVSKPKRKKKLSKESRINRSRVERNNELMSAVNESSNQCKILIARVEDLVLGLRDVASVRSIPSEVEELWSIVSRDLQSMKDKLNVIEVDKPTTLSSDETSNLLLCMNLATQYEEWINQFVDVIIPNSGRLTTHLTQLVSTSNVDTTSFTPEVDANNTTEHKE